MQENTKYCGRVGRQARSALRTSLTRWGGIRDEGGMTGSDALGHVTDCFDCQRKIHGVVLNEGKSSRAMGFVLVEIK